LPLLKPMSEVAGRLSIQEGAKCMEKFMGGMGLLLAGVPGVRRANVVIVGGGVVGTNACKMAVGLGANVTILDNTWIGFPTLTTFSVKQYRHCTVRIPPLSRLFVKPTLWWERC